MLKYQPSTPDMLADIALFERNKEVKQRYIGDLVWCVARFVQNGDCMMPYSDFAERLETDPTGKKQEDHVKSAIDTMVLTFLPKRGDANENP